ncbi:XdhC family protein [Streptomyces sp. ISL-98]|uniref:XdhC family protein n=1 Tax=Streptomyces sp. ISL-98 TaxID=2819192 RepID=UPI001BEB6CB2|nr:XdhC family protein [Streptomyces sp. ISL-98]MBT2510355.1 XdhC family protein [Streptomyces sp. ISL-98]
MHDLLSELRQWHRSGTDFAVATVVSVRGSAPRGPGAAMAVAVGGQVAGSVSGGCVEGAVYEAATDVLASGPPQLHTYGISDEEAFSVGLTCGGTLGVFVQAFSGEEDRAELMRILDVVERGEPMAVATIISSTASGRDPGARIAVRRDAAEGTLGDPSLDLAVTGDSRDLLSQGSTGLHHYGAQGQRRMDDVAVFVQSYAPPPRMLVFGAIDYAAATARMGSFLGYRVTVCDARPVFATPERFPTAHEVVCAWPSDYLASTETDARTAICVLTHDPKFDIPLLVTALRTPAGYIGVMGSRRTHADRTVRLRAAGVDEAGLRRLASPIGLDLGSRTPEETAVSIAAEIIQRRRGGTAQPLSSLTGDIHPLPD